MVPILMERKCSVMCTLHFGPLWAVLWCDVPPWYCLRVMNDVDWRWIGEGENIV